VNLEATRVTSLPEERDHGTYPVAPELLLQRAEQLRDQYRSADPFPHIVIDDFFPEAVLDAVLAEFPDPRGIDWARFDRDTENKLASKFEVQLGDRTRQFCWGLNSQVFISFLETLTGIEGLIPDPHLWGGGLHQIARGGFLKIHADFNRHPRLALDRRLNLLVYLNRDWKEEYGGHLELWTQDMSRCAVRVLPVFNRCVVFSTTDYSYHGHPDPVTCPEGRTRKSVAMYYYSNGRPEDEVTGEHNTAWKKRHADEFGIAPKQHAIKSLVQDWTPPALLRLLTRMRSGR